MFIIKYGDNKFYIENDGETIAEIAFRTEGDLLSIEHTVVSESLKGQGVGALLVEKVVNHARVHRSRVTSECDYAAHILQKRPEFWDVLS